MKKSITVYHKWKGRKISQLSAAITVTIMPITWLLVIVGTVSNVFGRDINQKLEYGVPLWLSFTIFFTSGLICIGVWGLFLQYVGQVILDSFSVFQKRLGKSDEIKWDKVTKVQRKLEVVRDTNLNRFNRTWIIIFSNDKSVKFNDEQENFQEARVFVNNQCDKIGISRTCIDVGLDAMLSWHNAKKTQRKHIEESRFSEHNIYQI